jgi:hypothetical protein
MRVFLTVPGVGPVGSRRYLRGASLLQFFCFFPSERYQAPRGARDLVASARATPSRLGLARVPGLHLIRKDQNKHFTRNGT